MRLAKRTLAAIIPALLITACGGGGDDGGAANMPAQTAGVTITETNSKQVAAEAFNETMDEQRADAPMGVELQASTSTNRLVRLAESLRLVGERVKPLMQATGAQVTETLACTNGGTVTTTTNMVDPNVGMVAGDSASLTANNCKEDLGGGVISTLNGTWTMNIVLDESSSIPYHVIVGYTFTNLTISDGVTVSGINGDMTIDVTDTTDWLKYKATGVSITFTDGADVATVKNYTRAVDYEKISTKYHASLSATVETNTLSSSKVSYQVSNLNPFVYDASVDTLSAGSMKVTGANSALLITVTDPNVLTLQVDANGDGAYEKTVTTTLAELRSL